MAEPNNQPEKIPDQDTVRLAMQLAWQDHHHARDQTWRALQIEAVLGAGLITVDTQFHNPISTTVAAILVAGAAVFGIVISLHHRNLECRKFSHIMNCEEYLGLRRKDLIPSLEQDPEWGVKRPEPFKFWDTFKRGQRSTAIFILRMHVAIILFSVVILITRLWSHYAHR